MRSSGIILAMFAATLFAACDVEKKTAEETPPQQQEPQVALVQLAPGGGKPQVTKNAEAQQFDGNPEQIAAGRQLFLAYNCVGCHFNGGGGIGPALMDSKWIYGSSMENIGSTIREGRPNGMPSFRAMVTDEQVWQLAAYVRSLSGLANNKTASTDDNL
jgi:cytochrome c oxidase cbb3-type subunit III